MSIAPHDTRGSFGLLRALIAGGLLFLLPLIVVVFLLGHAMKLAASAAEPIVKFLGSHGMSVPGPWIGWTVAAFILIAVSLLAGLFARTRWGEGAMRWTENSFLGGLPQYRLMKSMAQGLVEIENADGMTPVLVSVDGGWQIGYRLETIGNGFVAVFLPQAPTPMSGNVMYLPAERLRALDIPMAEAMALVKSMGAGSAKALRATDLTLPKGAD
jgi:uncharacterized membrane protein